MSTHTMLLVLVVFAVIGLVALVGHTHRTVRRAGWVMRDAAHTTSGVLRTLGIAAVVTGIEWVTATHVQDWRLLAVLAVPALLAGWTLTRRHRGWVVMAGRGRRR